MVTINGSNAHFIRYDCTPTYKILVVEDHTLTQMLYRRMLKKLGYQIHIVLTGTHAINSSADDDYYAMLLDLDLPDMEGQEVITAIRKRELETKKYLPIIIVSAHLDDALSKDCKKRGADATFLKPILRETLDHILKRIAQ